MRYKLPYPFILAHGAVLDTVDWASTPRIDVMLGGRERVTLEVVRGDVVRAATAKSAILIRRYADELTAADPEKYPQPKPHADEIAHVLTLRNPKDET